MNQIVPVYKFNLIELSTPVIAFLWGTWFLVFDPYSVSSVYKVFDKFPHYTVVVLFYSLAFSKALAVYKDIYWLRLAEVAVSVYLWVALCVIFALGNHESLLVPTCAYFAYQSLLSWTRITPHKNC
jgi:hypothetical protein